MAQIKVIIKDQTLARSVDVELPDNVPMNRLVPALVTRMNLPALQNGNPIGYAFDHKRTGKRLRPEDTLQGAGVAANDELIILPTPTAG